VPLMREALQSKQAPEPALGDAALLALLARIGPEAAVGLAGTIRNQMRRADSLVAIAGILGAQGSAVAGSTARSAAAIYRRLGKRVLADWALASAASSAAAKQPALAIQLLQGVQDSGDEDVQEAMVRAYARLAPARALGLAKSAPGPELAARLLCALAEERPASAVSYLRLASDRLIRVRRVNLDLAAWAAIVAVMLTDHGMRSEAVTLLEREAGWAETLKQIERGRVLILLAGAMSGADRKQATLLLDRGLHALAAHRDLDGYLQFAASVVAPLDPVLAKTMYDRMKRKRADPSVLLLIAIRAAARQPDLARRWLAEGALQARGLPDSAAGKADEAYMAQACVEGLLLPEPKRALATASRVRDQYCRAVAYQEVARSFVQRPSPIPVAPRQAIASLIALTTGTRR